jgi:hypothetical protein
MTNDELNPNDETGPHDGALAYAGFGIPSSFVIRASSFPDGSPNT